MMHDINYMALSEERYYVQLHNLRCWLIFLHGRYLTYRAYRVASLRAGLVGHISYNMYFDWNMYGIYYL